MFGMSDGHTNGQPTVTVAEAARVLGITPDSVRSRLQRGTLPGEKIAGIWHVTLPEGIGITRNTGQPGTDGHLQGALIEQLRSENLYLRERLEEADRQQAQMLEQFAEERRRADVLQLAASTGTHQDTPESPQTSETKPQGVLAWLRRWWSD